MMFKIIKKIFLIPTGIRWVKALESASKAEYGNALIFLDKIGGYMGKSPEYHALKGFVMFGIGDFNGTLSEMDIAKSQFDVSEKYTESDKAYMAIYIQYWKGKSCELIGKASLAEELLNALDYNSVNLGEVHNALKMNFPLRSHPNWVE